MSKVIVVDYDPNWPRVFEALRSSIWNAVADIAISIEHVGSTAVPRLASKPVIDIDVVVPEEAMAIGIARLTALGYRHRGDLGVPKREAFRSPDGSPPHHLYLCLSTSDALANHLAIRDYLRTHPASARAYGDLKKRLARDFANDRAGYVQAKTDFLVEILREIGFTDDRLAEIARINRKRRAARLLVIDGARSILLVRYKEYRPGRADSFWATPGGAIEVGESPQEAAIRELREETGLLTEVAQPVWRRTFRFELPQGQVEQEEEYFLVRLTAVAPRVWNSTAEAITEHRWWTLAALASTAETVYPEGLAEDLAKLL